VRRQSNVKETLRLHTIGAAYHHVLTTDH